MNKSDNERVHDCISEQFSELIGCVCGYVESLIMLIGERVCEWMVDWMFELVGDLL